MATNKLNPGLSAPFLNKLSAQVRHAVGTRTSPFEEIVIPINMMELMLEDRSTYDYLTANMHTLDEIGCNVVDKAVTFADGSYEQSLCRSRLRFIIRCLPFSHKVYKPIGSLSEYDINTWMIIEGTVVRMTQRKTLEKSKLFKCTTCGWQVRLTSTYHNSYSFVPPAKCTNRVDKPNSNNMYTKFFKGKTGKRSVSREN
jgi:DNA replicative helicase MCM subunit Mcm2 (Cdc46/Mcm family)